MDTDKPACAVCLCGGHAVVKIAVTLDEATELVPASKDTLYRAIRKARADGKFPPPLYGKRNGRGHLSVSVAELSRWYDSWEDA